MPLLPLFVREDALYTKALSRKADRRIVETPMTARAIGSGTISFGLVSVPVKLYSAGDSTAALSFNWIHKDCGSRLKQQYICSREGTVVEREDMVKGYEFAKDQYVIFTPLVRLPEFVLGAAAGILFLRDRERGQRRPGALSAHEARSVHDVRAPPLDGTEQDRILGGVVLQIGILHHDHIARRQANAGPDGGTLSAVGVVVSAVLLVTPVDRGRRRVSSRPAPGSPRSPRPRSPRCPATRP